MTDIMASLAGERYVRGMTNGNELSRREAVRHLVLLAAGSVLLGCHKETKQLSCMDTSALSPEDAAMRTTLEYVDHTPAPPKECDGCQLFKPAAPDSCGACTVLKGPIHPKGYCKSWVQKAA